MARRVLRSGICLGVIACAGFVMPAAAESLPDALARATPNGRASAPRTKMFLRR
jgi:hypothetical protein